MPRRRASMKGKGMEIFLPAEGEEATEREVFKKEKTKMVTFHIPVELEKKLDTVWLELRQHKRGVRKSGIVAYALEKVLDEYMEKKEDSELFKTLTRP